MTHRLSVAVFAAAWIGFATITVVTGLAESLNWPAAITSRAHDRSSKEGFTSRSPTSWLPGKQWHRQPRTPLPRPAAARLCPRKHSCRSQVLKKVPIQRVRLSLMPAEKSRDCRMRLLRLLQPEAMPRRFQDHLLGALDALRQKPRVLP
jgi:hypothetical protein